MQEDGREVSVVGTQTQTELHNKSALVEELDNLGSKSESSRRHLPKPSGRERRLQAPVFKERVERFLSKLKIREVKNELDTILKIDTLCLEGLYPQKVMRFSQLIFGPRNVPQVEQNIVSFGLNSSSRRGKDGQRSMNEGLLYSPKKRKFD
jgi:hypothetical protein